MTIKVSPGPGEIFNVVEMVLETLNFRDHQLSDRRDDAVESGKCLIAVPRNRFPDPLLAFFDSRPTPLVRMAIPIPDVDIHQARLQEFSRIDLLIVVFLKPPVEIICSNDSFGTSKARILVVFGSRVFFNRAKHAAEFLPKLTQSAHVWENYRAHSGIQNPYCV